METAYLVNWEREDDEEGNRNYKVTHQVSVDSYMDGPIAAEMAPGIPAVGSTFNYGNDYDNWAFCLPNRSFKPKYDKERGHIWEITSNFSTKLNKNKRCQDTRIDDPLAEPMKISGTFVKSKEEATVNLQGQALMNSAWEPIKGPAVQFDISMPTVIIQGNVLNLNLSLVCSMLNKVNSAPMWGLQARTVKLSDCSWERLYYGSCYAYYSLTLGFEIDYRTFDRYIPDYGEKVLNGYWTGNDTTGYTYVVATGANKNNPADFRRYIDPYGNPGKVYLNGAGVPALADVAVWDDVEVKIQPTKLSCKFVQFYREANFFMLGIPASL